jgi:2-polyprenyl-3-methyl-5-hydroxy-6-metoxy-1,4-benzoquinol methylase
MTKELQLSLVDVASEPYRAADSFAWYFARGKLRADPIFICLLERGLIPSNARLLDLGCGQGLLASWLLAARAHAEHGDWPKGWPQPPVLASIRGIELLPRNIERACRALGNRASFNHGSICDTDFGEADVIVMLDVLHYIDYESQARVLRRIHKALPPAGSLILRVGDAAGGLQFRISYVVDRLVWLLRGLRNHRLYCRSLADWQHLLQASGFSVETVSIAQGTNSANVLLVAKPVSAP